MIHLTSHKRIIFDLYNYCICRTVYSHHVNICHPIMAKFLIWTFHCWRCFTFYHPRRTKHSSIQEAFSHWIFPTTSCSIRKCLEANTQIIVSYTFFICIKLFDRKRKSPINLSHSRSNTPSFTWRTIIITSCISSIGDPEISTRQRITFHHSLLWTFGARRTQLITQL